MTNGPGDANERRVDPVESADWRRFVLFLVGAAVVILAVVAGIALLGDRLPPLTDDALDAAIDRWDERGVQSYAMDLEITGQRSGQVHVEVENGVAVNVNRDGQPLRERRTREVWGVPGQFDMMRRGLEVAKNPAGEMLMRKGTQVVVRAKFDPELGYPLGFSQVTLGGGPEFGWKTTRFERR